MTSAIALNLKTFLEDLKSADLVGVSLRPQNLGLRLDFTFGPEVGDVAIEFDRILHLALSRPINSDDENYCFWVGEVELRKLDENAETFLSSLSYPFNLPPNIDLASLNHFRLEGDMFVEIICEYYRIFQQVKN
ncbi:MAG: hypothetical protein HC849_23825 [Oscillatoriales cyanobacterium RU_3_3]|nr:hypothetical protein [Oscillatoriales cyanobacterium RU_3_3]NJR23076.1 hypothetical protein [Richelia sp. CSU_2_1]